MKANKYYNYFIINQKEGNYSNNNNSNSNVTNKNKV